MLHSFHTLLANNQNQHRPTQCPFGTALEGARHNSQAAPLTIKTLLHKAAMLHCKLACQCPCKRPNCVPFCLWLCCSGSTRSPYRRTVFWKMPGKGSGTGIACGTTHRACTQRSPACLAMSASNNTGKAARTDHLLVHANDNHKLQKGKLFLHRSRQQPASLPSNAGTAVQAEWDYKGSVICTACLCMH